MQALAAVRALHAAGENDPRLVIVLNHADRTPESIASRYFESSNSFATAPSSRLPTV
jgi:hypothetical protein